eukprot:scaffold16899_cov43-Cyclotella_meneghiniana.AAC.1
MFKLLKNLVTTMLQLQVQALELSRSVQRGDFEESVARGIVRDMAGLEKQNNSSNGNGVKDQRCRFGARFRGNGS